MTLKQRDALLASMTDDVGRRVLVDNYQQTQAVSLEATYGRDLLNGHGRITSYNVCYTKLLRRRSVRDHDALAGT